MEGCAPNLVTEMEAAATAKRLACSMRIPSANAAANAPAKQSPAPTVSIAFTFGAVNQRIPPAPHQQTPREPQVTSTCFIPAARSFVAEASTSDFDFTGNLVNTRNSCSFGVKNIACRSRLAGTG